MAFTAGEPFVELEARHAPVALAHSHGVAREVVISAAWVGDQPRCRAVPEALKSEGPVKLCGSYARLHTEYVPTWKVTAAIRAGLDVGLCVVS